MYFAFAFNLVAQGTNIMYFPEERYPFCQDKTDVDYNKQARETAIQAGECLPAELDPQGHWGEIVGGFQLSIRSATNVFIVGKPVPITVILRNTSTNVLPVIPPVSVGFVVVEDEAGKKIPDNNLDAGGSGGSAEIEGVTAKHELIDQFDLQERLALAKAGVYRIYLKQPICLPATNFAKSVEAPSPSGTPPAVLHAILPTIGSFTNLSSGVLMISLVAPTNSVAK